MHPGHPQVADSIRSVTAPAAHWAGCAGHALQLGQQLAPGLTHGVADTCSTRATAWGWLAMRSDHTR